MGLFKKPKTKTLEERLRSGPCFYGKAERAGTVCRNCRYYNGVGGCSYHNKATQPTAYCAFWHA